MKVTHKDLKKGEVKLTTESLDDLWYLSHIVEPKDLVSGKTMRKVKIGDSENAKVVRKPVFITIEVEKVDFTKSSNVLKILGVVREGPEDVPSGSHHSFNVEENTQIKITKEKWLKYQLDKLDEACKQKSNTLILILDRDVATFALLKSSGYDILLETRGDVQKKGDDSVIKGDFFAETVKLLQDYLNRYEVNSVLVASPGFWKEEFKKKVPDDFPKKIFYATCNDSGRKGVDEVLKRDEVKTLLKEDRIAKETIVVEQLLTEISKGKLAAYGLDEVKKSIEAGAVKTLLVTDNYIRSEDHNYEETDNLMKLADSLKAEVHVISSDHDAGKKLDGLGGIASILRYEI